MYLSSDIVLLGTGEGGGTCLCIPSIWRSILFQFCYVNV